MGPKQTRQEIKQAEVIAEDRPEEVSVAASQAEYLARIFSLNLKPDGNTIDWTLMGTSVAISLFVSIFAHLCNLIPALNLANVREDDPPPSPVSRNPFLPDNRPGPAPQAAREAYRANPTVHRSHHSIEEVVVPGGTEPLQREDGMDFGEAVEMAHLRNKIRTYVQNLNRVTEQSERARQSNGYAA